MSLGQESDREGEVVSCEAALSAPGRVAMTCQEAPFAAIAQKIGREGLHIMTASMHLVHGGCEKAAGMPRSAVRTLHHRRPLMDTADATAHRCRARAALALAPPTMCVEKLTLPHLTLGAALASLAPLAAARRGVRRAPHRRRRRRRAPCRPLSRGPAATRRQLQLFLEEAARPLQDVFVDGPGLPF